jgi:uncharacterized protein
MIHRTDKPQVEHYLSLAGRPLLSAYSFVSIYAWKDFFDFHLEIIDEALCVFAENSLGCFLYLPPLGKSVSEKALNGCLEFMRAKNRDPKATRLENVGLAHLAHFFGKGFVIECRSQEYIYDSCKVSELSGNEYKSPRALCNHFTREYSFECQPFRSDLTERCLALYQKWAASRQQKCGDELYGFMLEDNLAVHRRIMENFTPLGLKGLVVLVDGEVAAYTFGFSINREVFCVFLEVADLAVSGLAAFIFREFSREIKKLGYRFINAMDDFGLPNLTKTKMAYRPVALAPVYAVGVC